MSRPTQKVLTEWLIRFRLSPVPRSGPGQWHQRSLRRWNEGGLPEKWQDFGKYFGFSEIFGEVQSPEKWL